MRNISKKIILSLLGLSLLAILNPNEIYALAQEYKRNGECYMLIGVGQFRGIYRLNNASTNQ